MYEWLEAHQLPCLFREIWGIECPGCGFQTAVLLLIRGHIQAAVFAWPGILPLILFGMLILLRCCGVRKITTASLKIAGYICLATIFMTYIFRIFGE